MLVSGNRPATLSAWSAWTKSRRCRRMRLRAQRQRTLRCGQVSMFTALTHFLEIPLGLPLPATFVNYAALSLQTLATIVLAMQLCCASFPLIGVISASQCRLYGIKCLLPHKVLCESSS